MDDAIQPSHPLLPPSPLALNLSQHQGLFQGVSSLRHTVKVLELHPRAPLHSPQTHTRTASSVPLLWERQEPLGKASHPAGSGLSGHQAGRWRWSGLQVPMGGAGGPVWTWPAPCSPASESSGGSLGVTQRELCSPMTAALVSSGTCLSRLHSPCVASCCGLNSYLPTPVGPTLARCFLEMPPLPMTFLGAFSGDSVGGNPPVHVGNVGSIPGPGRPHVLRINSAWALQLFSLPRAQEPQLLSPHSTSTEDRALQSPCSAAREATSIGSPRTTTRELPPLAATREKPAAVKTQYTNNK